MRFVFPFARWGILLVRIALILFLAGELYVTATIQRPDLMHPTAIGTDSSTYYAAGQRLNAGHTLRVARRRYWPAGAGIASRTRGAGDDYTRRAIT